MAGDLRLDTVKGWIQQAAVGKPWREWVQEFRAGHGDWFELGEIRGESYGDPRRAFMAAVLDYYLRDA